MKGIPMIIIVAIGYTLANFYIGLHFYKWIRSFERKVPFFAILFSILFAVAASTPVIAGILTESNPLFRTVKILSNYWLGILVYAVISVVVIDLILLISKIFLHRSIFKNITLKRATGTLAVLFVVLTCVFGAMHAKNIKTVSYDVQIDKKAGTLTELRIALLSDTHFGYNSGVKRAQDIVAAINKESPDIVLFAGDIFDNNFSAIENPDEVAKTLAGIQSTYGSFACYGNHDYNENLFVGFTSGNGNDPTDAEYRDFFNKAKITLLQDESILIDNAFYVIGREDTFRAGKLNGRKKTGDLTDGLNKNLPIIVIDHQPREYEMLAAAGVDLDLSGHTHNGQVFPGNLITAVMYDNSYGVAHYNHMTGVTTSGAGIWGPPIRVGTDSEVAIVNVTFNGKN